ncbi:arginine--tRNA ligase, partial [Phytoactinopolyspora endophytica]|uniref:arginine--tRNA ligase domain-containing protein n=1 Tax=Phytoactinopolyspora endophytica TaxID=1642495 RepID=UPI001F0E5948
MSDHAVVPLLSQIASDVSEAIGRIRPDLVGADPVVRRSDHADFQSNAALSLAKQTRTAPAELASALAEALEAAVGGTGPIETVELSGPGFLNITISDRVIWEQASVRLADRRLGVGSPEVGRRTVVDYSGPNIAKEMHVGHLRTTIIGDCLARVLGFLGADVVRQNHLGDWGTQFGMLIQYLDEHPDAAWHQDEVAAGASAVSALDELYKASRAAFDADTSFADRARARVVGLQSGDAATLARWNEIVAESEKAFRDIYDRLDVLLTPEDSVGESFYQPMLGDTIAELVNDGVAVESDGAVVIFSEGVTGPDGQ